MTLAAGFVLGAIVSPPDAVAASAVLKNLRVPKRLSDILEGESLVNDASGLVAYQFAVAAVVTGSFSLGEAAGDFRLDGRRGNFLWLGDRNNCRPSSSSIARPSRGGHAYHSHALYRLSSCGKARIFRGARGGCRRPLHRSSILGGAPSRKPLAARHCLAALGLLVEQRHLHPHRTSVSNDRARNDNSRSTDDLHWRGDFLGCHRGAISLGLSDGVSRTLLFPKRGEGLLVIW